MVSHMRRCPGCAKIAAWCAEVGCHWCHYACNNLWSAPSIGSRRTIAPFLLMVWTQLWPFHFCWVAVWQTLSATWLVMNSINVCGKASVISTASIMCTGTLVSASIQKIVVALSSIALLCSTSSTENPCSRAELSTFQWEIETGRQPSGASFQSGVRRQSRARTDVGAIELSASCVSQVKYTSEQAMACANGELHTLNVWAQ